MTTKLPAPPIPSIGQLHRQSDWWWIHCGSQDCNHKIAAKLQPFIDRWGADASSDVIRERLRCSACGHLGVTLQHPSWGGSIYSGFQPFPGEDR